MRGSGRHRPITPKGAVVALPARPGMRAQGTCSRRESRAVWQNPAWSRVMLHGFAGIVEGGRAVWHYLARGRVILHAVRRVPQEDL